MNKRVKAVNPSSLKIEEGIVILDLRTRKMYKIKFTSGEYYVEKSMVTFI
jgi:hypothetical protein